jgi:hypothetical protein
MPDNCLNFVIDMMDASTADMACNIPTDSDDRNGVYQFLLKHLSAL